MTRNSSIEIELDCIGQKCPGPVLRIAREVAALGQSGGFLSIRADDPAFRSDMEAWARGTSAQILEFGGEPNGVLHALVAVGDARFVPPPEAPPTDETLDLRGMACHEPILALAKAVDDRPVGSLIRMVADDPVFVMELDGWLRDGRAELVDIESTGETRVCVRVIGSTASQSPSPFVVEPAARSTVVPLLIVSGPGTDGVVATVVAPVAAPVVATVIAPVASSNRCTLLVLHNDHEALLAALLVANGAAAQGMETSLFFTFWGLNLLRGDAPNPVQPYERVGFMRRLMRWMMPKGPKHQRLGQMHFAGAGKLMLSSIMRSQGVLGLPDLMRSAQELGVEFTACTMSMSVMGITRRDLHPYANLKYAGVATFVERAQHSAISLVF